MVEEYSVPETLAPAARWLSFVLLAIATVSCGASEETSAPESQPSRVVPQQSEIDWAAAQGHPAFDDAQLSEEQSSTLEQTSVPVLLLDDPEALRNAVLTAGPGWYSISMKYEGFAVVVSGSRHQLQVEGVEPPELPDYGAEDLQVVQAEGIAELVFRAYGAIYTIAVECEDPENDTHCTEDAYALEIADSLRLSAVNQP